MLMHLLLRGLSFYRHGNRPPCDRRLIQPAVQSIKIDYGIIPAAGLAVSQRP